MTDLAKLIDDGQQVRLTVRELVLTFDVPLGDRAAFLQRFVLDTLKQLQESDDQRPHDDWLTHAAPYVREHLVVGDDFTNEQIERTLRSTVKDAPTLKLLTELSGVGWKSADDPLT